MRLQVGGESEEEEEEEEEDGMVNKKNPVVLSHPYS